MSKPVKYKFSKARVAILAVSSISILTIAYMLSGVSNKYKLVSTIQNGIQICSTRVQQTYTAAVAGDMNSTYMDSNFTSQTGECFAQVTDLMNEYGKFSSAIIKKFNTVSSNVHWFHESLRSTGKGFSVTDQNFSKNIDEKYSQFEDAADAGSILIENHVETISSSLSNIKLSLALIAAVFLFTFVWEGVFRKIVLRRRKELEDEALSLLMLNQDENFDEIESVIMNALELNEMKHCSKLYSAQKQSFRKEKRKSTISANENKTFGMLLSNDDADAKEVADEIWSMSEDSNAQESEKNLDESNVPMVKSCEISSVNRFIACKVQDQFKDQGIEFSIDTQEREILGERETIEQIQYSILTDAAKNTLKASEESEEKTLQKVEVQGKTLGAIYYLSISSYGDNKSGVELETSVQIVRELLKDISGRLELANLYNDDLQPVGRKYKLIFKTKDINQVALQEKKEEPKSEESNKKVTRIEKGTKREIMQRLM
ncbi:hypothetical protein DAY19_01340 [Halobacteriovorax vibrionivorans]|uniref:Uncharacterized protein n=1 Tax=Halobacteriovorax vibrionivorans TaxID=2152716 RepID=A0ABY0IJZ9_9BACT|nr:MULTISPECIES: hypothetical protein [Halobacteriovorax]RZF22443.1 hypothetical protein DAY19_01340 [Halobacteriovorax vibrionivorans]TGD47634.1 hypothetical protein EP118_06700 [Halobacteriovorax sp. Y22]